MGLDVELYEYPTIVSGLVNIVKIECGYTHSVALDN